MGNENSKTGTGLEFVHTRLVRDSWMKPEKTVTSPEEAVSLLQEIICDLPQEVMAMINISQSRVINASILNMGTSGACMVSMPELFRAAILSGASSFLLLHNHPSGKCNPSKDDFVARIKHNHGIVERLSNLEQAERQSITNYYAKATVEKETPRRILIYYKTKDIALLGQMELSEVEECLKAAKERKTPTPPAASGKVLCLMT